MMPHYQNVLAIIDPTTEEQKALNRAIEYASLTGAKITAFLSIYDFSYEMTTMLSYEEREAMRKAVIHDRDQWLKSIVDEEQSEFISDYKVHWHNRPFEAILQTCEEHGYDLIIKGTHEHDFLKSVIFTPTDWQLLRKSQVPVLLVKDHEWPQGGNIITAVNLTSDNDAHQKLNDRLIEEAHIFKDILNSQVHLVNSYPGAPVNISIEVPEFDPVSYGENIKKHHHKAMEDLAEKHNLPKQNTHLHEGLPEDVIPKVAEELDAELAIIGSMGRTGLSAAFIGNTAEHVVDNLNCDVLAIGLNEE